MMRILVVIPHYFGAGSSSYGSTDLSQRARRANSLRGCIVTLHQQFGGSQFLQMYDRQKRIVNQQMANDLDVVVCVRGEEHLLDDLNLPGGCYRKHDSDIEDPRYLGYVCYDVFRECAGQYDWYCFLEDDILIKDPLFFSKLQLFYDVVGSARYLLQPNRYELGVDPPCKMYIDGPLWDDTAEFLASLRLPGCKDEIEVEFGNQRYRLTPAENPHSGCFFLTEIHLGHMLEQPWYGEHNNGYAGPLESAASLYITTLFHVFKPADECASFLEVHHDYQKHLKRESNA